MDDVKERAAIKEFDARMPRAEAEMQSKADNKWCAMCCHWLDSLDSVSCRNCGLERENWEKKS